MIKSILTLAVLLFSFVIGAQELSGRAVYQSKMSLNTKEPTTEEQDKQMAENAELIAQIKEAMRKSSEKSYILEFNTHESFFKEEEKLAEPKVGSHQISVTMNSTSSGKLYKNLKDNYSLLENDYLGKVFLIKDSLHTSGWELGTESKKVGNYTVYKATKTIKPKRYISEDDQTDVDEKESGILSMIKKEPQDITYTAWYTPEIPISNGPEAYGGLPGLILELHSPKMVYLCSEIILNPKKSIKIKAPKGKVIAQSEFDEMVKERMKHGKKTKSGAVILETMTIGG